MEMQGKRLTGAEVEAAGDLAAALDRAGPGAYHGPITGYTGDKPAVFYLLPIARDPDVLPSARSIRHVTSPPHTFHEEEDGSLTIRASILHEGAWHGFLEHGVWRS